MCNKVPNKSALNVMALHLNIALQWMQRYGTCLGNKFTDELVRKGVKLSADITDHFCDISLSD